MSKKMKIWKGEIYLVLYEPVDEEVRKQLIEFGFQESRCDYDPDARIFTCEVGDGSLQPEEDINFVLATYIEQVEEIVGKDTIIESLLEEDRGD